MCIYRQDGDTLRATERYLYGSKRLGMLEQQIWITANSIGLQDSNTIGVRIYEVTDHLGNVTYTAQDRKHLVQDSYGQWQYIPSAVSYTDYYPFGYPMPGRSTDNGGYRYFFNGQEGDGEAYGQGGLAGYELEYIRYADNKGSLNDDLKAHGWVRTKPKSPQMMPPAMTDLLATNEQIGLARIWRS